MFFDYALFSSFVLSAILLILLALLKRNLENQSNKKPTNLVDSEQSLKLKINVLYFFLYIIVLSRTLFSFSFPMQMSKLNIFARSDLLLLAFMIFQGLMVLIYASVIFFFWLNHQIKAEDRIAYIQHISTVSIWIILTDLLISAFVYFYINITHLFQFTNFEIITINLPVLIQYAVMTGLMLVLIVIYWILRSKQNTLNHIILFVITQILGIIAIYLTFSQIKLLFNDVNLFNLFTYQYVFYGWFWLAFVVLSAGSQVLAAFVIRFKSRFINRYFAINYSLQLNRLALTAVIGLVLITIFPNILISLFNG